MTSVLKKLDEKIHEMTLSALGWTPAETYYPLEGEILFSQLTEGNWKKTWTKDELTMICALLVVQSTDELPIVTCNEEQLLPPESANIKDAVFVLVKSEDSNYSLLKDPLPLDNCVLCCKQEWDDCFEIQELANKESFVFKGETPEQTQIWFKTLHYYSQKLGGWRKRRKGLGNIVIDSSLVGLQPDDNPDACGASGHD